MKKQNLESMEKFKNTLPPVFWSYEVRKYPAEYFKDNYIPDFEIDRLQTRKRCGTTFYKPISKF